MSGHKRRLRRSFNRWQGRPKPSPLAPEYEALAALGRTFKQVAVAFDEMGAALGEAMLRYLPAVEALMGQLQPTTDAPWLAGQPRGFYRAMELSALRDRVGFEFRMRGMDLPGADALPRSG